MGSWNRTAVRKGKSLISLIFKCWFFFLKKIKLLTNLNTGTSRIVIPSGKHLLTEVFLLVKLNCSEIALRPSLCSRWIFPQFSLHGLQQWSAKLGLLKTFKYKTHSWIESSSLCLISTAHLANDCKNDLTLLEKLLHYSYVPEDQPFKSWPGQQWTKWFLR